LNKQEQGDGNFGNVSLKWHHPSYCWHWKSTNVLDNIA
jgi:hypothetical protein